MVWELSVNSGGGWGVRMGLGLGLDIFTMVLLTHKPTMVLKTDMTIDNGLGRGGDKEVKGRGKMA